MESHREYHREMHHHRRHHTEIWRNYRLIALIAVIVVIIAAVALLSLGGARTISGPTTLVITKSPTVLKMNGIQYVFALSSTSKGSGQAYLFVEQPPIFINPILNVTLVLSNATKVNSGSVYANMQILLNSISNNSVNITVTPLNLYLQESPDYSRIRTMNSTINIQVSSNSTAQYSTTTISQTTSTSISTSTTTINQTQQNYAKIMIYLKNDVYYPIMLNYTTVYANTRNCTESLYNSSYVSQFGYAPAGTATYVNVSAVVPYYMSEYINYSGGGNYAVRYKTLSYTSFTNGTALTVYINISKGTIYNSTLSGVFTDTNASAMLSGLQFAARISNACGIYIASS